MARDIENKEWLDDYLSLKQVSTKNPFTVPEDYFKGLDERIISAIKLDELKIITRQDGFTVPENYFEELGSNIQSRVAVDELINKADNGFNVPSNYFEELSSNIQSRLAVDELVNADHTGLTVPDNYFEELSNHIQSRVAVNEFIDTAHTGLTVPANYFEDLSSKIQSRLQVEEALLNAQNTLSVPPDYFDRLNKNILNKTVNQDIVKRKSAVIRMISSTAFKYATAACFVLMLGTGVFLQMESPVAIHDRSFLHKELSAIPVSDIQSYLEQNVDGTDTQHTVTSENLAISPDELKAALQDYTDQ